MKKLISILVAAVGLNAWGAISTGPGGGVTVTNDIPQSQVTGLTAALAAKAGTNWASRVQTGLASSNLWLLANDVTVPTRKHTKPYKGFSSYYTFGSNGHETNYLQAATNWVNSGMLAAGYDWFWFTSGWQNPTRGGGGELLANPTYFPSGLTNIIKQLHSMGLKCGGALLGSTAGASWAPGSVGYQSNDVWQIKNTFGFDGIVIDNSHDAATTPAELQANYETFIYWVKNITPNLLLLGNYFDPFALTPDPLGAPAAYTNEDGLVTLNVARIAPWQVRNNNSTTYTVEWGVISTNAFLDIMGHVDLVNRAKGYIAPGSYIWMGDMLANNWGIAKYLKTAATMWSMFHAPFTSGTPTSFPYGETTSYFTNSAILAIDDDSLAAPPEKVYTNGGSCEVWVMPCENGDKVVAFVNRSPSTTTTVTPPFGAMGMGSNICYLATDVWTNRSDWWSNSVSVSLAPESVECYRVAKRAFDPDVLCKAAWIAEDAKPIGTTGFVLTDRVGGIALTNFGAQTTWPTNAFVGANYRPALKFDGVNDYLASGSYTSSWPHTVMMVCRYDTARDGNFHQFFDGYPTSARHGGGQNSSGNLYLVQGGGSLIDGLLTTNTMTQFEFVVNAANSAIYTNGIAAASGTSSDSSQMAGFTLGNYGDLGTLAPAAITVLEVRTFNQVLSATSRNLYWAWARARYGL